MEESIIRGNYMAKKEDIDIYKNAKKRYSDYRRKEEQKER